MRGSPNVEDLYRVILPDTYWAVTRGTRTLVFCRARSPSKGEALSLLSATASETVAVNHGDGPPPGYERGNAAPPERAA